MADQFDPATFVELRQVAEVDLPFPFDDLTAKQKNKLTRWYALVFRADAELGLTAEEAGPRLEFLRHRLNRIKAEPSDFEETGLADDEDPEADL